MARQDVFNLSNPHSVQLLNEMLRELFERVSDLERRFESLV